MVTQRLKRSGMRWRRPGGQAILTLRALVQSSRFDQAWALLSETYRQEVIVPGNVVAFPCKTCRMTNQCQTYTPRFDELCVQPIHEQLAARAAPPSVARHSLA